MAAFLLIESRDPFETRGVEEDYDLAASLASAGNDVTLFLVQNGVLPTRASAKCEPLERVAASGATVLADDFSLRERGIPDSALAAGVRSAPLDIVVDQLAEGRKTLWL